MALDIPIAMAIEPESEQAEDEESESVDEDESDEEDQSDDEQEMSDAFGPAEKGTSSTPAGVSTQFQARRIKKYMICICKHLSWCKCTINPATSSWFLLTLNSGFTLLQGAAESVEDAVTAAADYDLAACLRLKEQGNTAFQRGQVQLPLCLEQVSPPVGVGMIAVGLQSLAISLRLMASRSPFQRDSGVDAHD